MSVTDVKQAQSHLYEFGKSQLGGLKRLLVVGDLHGDYKTLSTLLKVANLAEDGIVFLGDYADRGPDGVEVIDAVNSLIGRYPNVVALKGNHEDYSDDGRPSAGPCTLIEEVEAKRGSWRSYFQKEFKPFTEKLYLAAVIPEEILFVHGGISSKIRSLDDLRHPTKEMEIDVLWSDPSDIHYSNKLRDEYHNARGAGVMFSERVTQEVCKRLGVKRIIRSHEPRKAFTGPSYEHNGMIVTTSSTIIYGGRPFTLIIDPANPSNTMYATYLSEL